VDAIPTELRYTESHEWVREESAKEVLVGITEHAQDALGELVFVKLPEVGDIVHAGDEVAVVESVKAASDVYAPVSGEIIAINDSLEEAPSLVNQDPYGDGWLFKIRLKDTAELEHLLDAEGYQEQIGEEE